MSGWLRSGSIDAPAGIWRPERVEAPRRRVAGDAHLVRIRVPDRCGSLAELTARLAWQGVDVLGLEVLAREEGFAVDDLLVSGPGLASALCNLGPRFAVLAHRHGVDLVDPAMAMASACRSLTGAVSERETYRQLLSAALGLVFAEAGFLSLRLEHGLLRPLASTVDDLPVLGDGDAPLLCSALETGERLTADGRVPWVAPSYRDRLPRGTVAVIPSGREPSFVLALVREDTTPFVSTELDRLGALVEVATGTLALHGAAELRRGLRLARGGARQ